LQDAVEFLANLVIPEPEHNNSVTIEEFRPPVIANPTCTMAMPAAVQLNGELCGRTIEI